MSRLRRDGTVVIGNPSSTGLMRACGAVAGVDVGLRDADVDRLTTITSYLLGELGRLGRGANPAVNTPRPSINRGVCLCVFSFHPFWTSSSLDVPAGVTQEEGHTGFLIHLPSAVRALIFVARRIQPFLSLVDREVEFCVLTN